jgi:hypothetical protein
VPLVAGVAAVVVWLGLLRGFAVADLVGFVVDS